MDLDYPGRSKIAVIDFGGQYAHLIASRIRRLGAYSEIVQPEDLNPELARSYKGIIYSGGPASVYDPDSPVTDPNVLEASIPILGICYGHQLIMHQLGGKVSRSNSREYGPADLQIQKPEGLFESAADRKTVWMSHGDEVIELPQGFMTVASTDDCKQAAVANPEKQIYGIQFHPEVTHSEEGEIYLRNFISICGLSGSWNLQEFLKIEIDLLKKEIGNKKVFFLVSGGVDSTVAFAMLTRALKEEVGEQAVDSRLKGLLVDTGFMRLNEANSVRSALAEHGIHLLVENASEKFFKELENISDPEKKRAVIGKLFLDVQADAVKQLGLNPDEWMLGQGTIYPDTIESGATKSSHTIKTHHNRVAEVAALIEKGMVIEPLKDLYKDEVRKIGSLLGLPDSIVNRHPFPGPGLAVRCLCTSTVEDKEPINITERVLPLLNEQEQEILNFKVFQLPVSSVGVQGDQRTYAHPALIDISETEKPLSPYQFRELARKLPNRMEQINRVLFLISSISSIENFRLFENRFASQDRITGLQIADDIIDGIQRRYNLYKDIWQFPVVLVPFGDSEHSRESIVLRPIESVDAMTARPYQIDETVLKEMADTILATGHFSAVFFDLTSKPPGTIEWE